MRKGLLVILIVLPALLKAEDGYDLWLRYKKIPTTALLDQYKKQINSPVVFGASATIAIIKAELSRAFSGLTGTAYKILSAIDKSSTFIAGISSSSTIISSIVTKNELNLIGNEGFIIKTRPGKTIITANTDVGVLYGVFHFLRLMQTQQAVINLTIISSPKIKLRFLDHWDNLNRTVERGYAGFSIWDWHKLPDLIDKRYIDYARANASIGINSTVLTNVNANAAVLTKPYLEKVKEIYELIPDFGGFLVKANSEGQPGPQDYNRTHADGANMLADAVAPFNGIIMWRAFVYSSTSNDRFKQAYEEFKPLDGKFRKNVLVQVKNGPIDFQPREPFSPLFGAMQQTPLMMEFQLTQEYLGQGTHLVFEAPLFKEVLNADTYSKGKGSTVTKVIDGSLNNFSLNGIAGVSNIGNDINWCGHPFAQANWYAFGRLCWDYDLSSEQIADEWIRQTFTNDPSFVEPVKKIMLQSREVLVDYMTPLGLTHIMYNGHHYGPMPWGNTLNRPDWNPVYYHKADLSGIGFDRTVTGTNALSQYSLEVQNQFNDINKCPEDYLLWFHHVSWEYRMRSGRTLWDELCYKYYTAVDSMKAIQKQWNKFERYIDAERFDHVKQLLNIQVKDATWWRNACLLYFQTFSKMQIPAQYEQPDRSLEYYQNIRILYAPGNTPVP